MLEPFNPDRVMVLLYSGKTIPPGQFEEQAFFDEALGQDGVTLSKTTLRRPQRLDHDMHAFELTGISVQVKNSPNKETAFAFYEKTFFTFTLQNRTYAEYPSDMAAAELHLDPPLRWTGSERFEFKLKRLPDQKFTVARGKNPLLVYCVLRGVLVRPAV